VSSLHNASLHHHRLTTTKYPPPSLTDSPGLSHTRSAPPTMEELQSDSARQSRLRPMVAAIEAREEAERIRQGYLAPPSGSETPSIAGPSRLSTPPVQPRTQIHPTQPQQTPTPSFPSVNSSATSHPPRQAPSQPQSESIPTYPVPTPPSSALRPPRETLDPTRHTSTEELRRLAEEDTKRRIEESGVDPGSLAEGEGDQGSKSGGGEGLTPRRRGRG